MFYLPLCYKKWLSKIQYKFISCFHIIVCFGEQFKLLIFFTPVVNLGQCVTYYKRVYPPNGNNFSMTYQWPKLKIQWPFTWRKASKRYITRQGGRIWQAKPCMKTWNMTLSQIPWLFQVFHDWIHPATTTICQWRLSLHHKGALDNTILSNCKAVNRTFYC